MPTWYNSPNDFKDGRRTEFSYTFPAKLLPTYSREPIDSSSSASYIYKLPPTLFRFVNSFMFSGPLISKSPPTLSRLFSDLIGLSKSEKINFPPTVLIEPMSCTSASITKSPPTSVRFLEPRLASVISTSPDIVFNLGGRFKSNDFILLNSKSPIMRSSGEASSMSLS